MHFRQISNVLFMSCRLLHLKREASGKQVTALPWVEVVNSRCNVTPNCGRQITQQSVPQLFAPTGGCFVLMYTALSVNSGVSITVH